MFQLQFSTLPADAVIAALGVVLPTLRVMLARMAVMPLRRTVEHLLLIRRQRGVELLDHGSSLDRLLCASVRAIHHAIGALGRRQSFVARACSTRVARGLHALHEGLPCRLL